MKAVARSTIGEVAEAAGCSTASVSRVLNGSGPTSPALRSAVEKAVRELGYRPSAAGRVLKTQRSRTLGCIIPSLTNPVFASSVSGVESSARRRGWSVLLATTDYQAEREVDVVETLLARDVEGLILTVTDADTSRALRLLDREDVPYVLVYNEPRKKKRPSVTVDNAKSTRFLAERLIELGHTRIGFVAGRFSSSDRSKRRYEGYLEALQKENLAPIPVIEVDYLATSDSHRSDLNARLASAGRPTALMCSNDLLALSIISALREMRYRIPQDVSVTGFDGIALGRMVSPQLSTIDQKPIAMGFEATQKLLDAIESNRPAKRSVQMIDYEFRTGETLAPAPTI